MLQYAKKGAKLDQILDDLWGVERLYLDKNFSLNIDEDSASIVLCANISNYDRLFTMDSFRQVVEKFDYSLNLHSVQILQVGVINSIQNLQISRQNVIANLQKFQVSKILSFSQTSNLINFLNSLKLENNEKSDKLTSKNMNFHKNLDILNQTYFELLKLSDEGLKKRLKISNEVANCSKFHIAVTGVINAGKSTMLNAFLNEKILGTSNIPETINLSLLTYAKEPFARLEFWDLETQKSMELEPKNLAEKTISLDEIKNYTTAKNEISKYVKMVEIGTNLEILKDGICIVDTPGLDDIVVAREELTRKYMQQSDFILHLMNAAQSATKKDMSFIIQTLKESKNSGFAVVLTHIDKLSATDLQEVIKYTKNSIKDEISELDDICFFCIDGLNGTGIDELKGFLYDNFFGENSKKANMILQNYKKEILLVCDILAQNFTQEIKMLNLIKGGQRSKESEIFENIKGKNAKLDEILSELSSAQERLDYAKFSQNLSLNNQISRISDRLVADIKYAKEKRQKLDLQRLKTIAISGLNDAFVDIFREFGQRVYGDINEISNLIKLKLTEIKEFQNLNFLDIRNFISQNLPKVDYQILNTNLEKIILKDQNIEVLKPNLDEFLLDFVANFSLDEKLQNLAKSSTQSFLDFIKFAISDLQKELDLQIENLNDSLKNLNNDMEKLDEKIELLSQNLENLAQIKSRIC